MTHSRLRSYDFLGELFLSVDKMASQSAKLVAASATVAGVAYLIYRYRSQRKLSKAASIPQPTLPPRSAAALSVGDVASARWKMGRRWYRVVVDAVNDDGTYSLTYEDGDKWTAVPPEFVRTNTGVPLVPASPALRPGLRHEVVPEAVSADYLTRLFPFIKEAFQPQVVKYSNTNPDISSVDGKHGERIDWKVRPRRPVGHSLLFFDEYFIIPKTC